MRKVFSVRFWKTFIVMLGIIILFFYMNNLAISTMIHIARNEIENQNELIVNDVLTTFEFNKNSYEDFYKISRDENGKIYSFESNSTYINEYSRSFAATVQKEIKKNKLSYVKVPLFSFLSFKVLYANGTEVKLKIQPISVVSCDFKSVFEDKGINQTRHCVFLAIKIKTALSIPNRYTEVVNECDFMLFDVIIVGDVPEIYLLNTPNA